MENGKLVELFRSGEKSGNTWTDYCVERIREVDADMEFVKEARRKGLISENRLCKEMAILDNRIAKIERDFHQNK